MQKSSELLRVDVAKVPDSKKNDKVFWINEYISPEDISKEFEMFHVKPIPVEMGNYFLRPNSVIFEVFAINVNKYKEAIAKINFEANKAAGIIPITQEYQPLLYTRDSSGNINSEWVFFPIAKVLKISSSEKEYNPLGIMDGNYVRLSDSLAWRAENPVYKKFVSEHPYPEAIGLTQVTATPQQFIYNMIDGNGGLARDSFNVNPFTNKWFGFVFMKLVTEFTAVIEYDNLKDMLKLAAEPQQII